jgi:putative secretion ATPase (PEP-CTERM system associated)
MYEEYFGLSAKPFQLTPDPAFLYSSKGHKRAAAYLQYGLHKGEGFIVITGEVGAGKTTLLRGMLEQIDPAAIVVANIVSSRLDPEQLLRQIAAEFGIQTDESIDKAALLGKLREFLTSVHDSGKRALLVIDEAQNLSIEAIEEVRMLSNFSVGPIAPFQAFLVGQPQLHTMMRNPELHQFRQRTVASYHLGPLEEQDVQAYILHRLAHVGASAENPKFEEAVFAEIYSATGGIPRRINLLADQILLAAYLDESRTVTPEIVAAAIEEIGENIADQQTIDSNGSGPNGLHTDTMGQANALAMAVNGSNLGLSAVRGDLGVRDQNLSEMDMRISALEASNVLVVQTLRRLLTEIERGR